MFTVSAKKVHNYKKYQNVTIIFAVRTNVATILQGQIMDSWLKFYAVMFFICTVRIWPVNIL